MGGVQQYIEKKLIKLALYISYFGTAAAVLCLLVFNLYFVITEFGIIGRSRNHSTGFSELLYFIIICITVLISCA